MWPSNEPPSASVPRNVIEIGDAEIGVPLGEVGVTVNPPLHPDTSTAMSATPMALSIRVIVPPDEQQGGDQNLEVEQHRPVSDVPEIVFDPRAHLLERVGL